jgi:hypothetical protein
MTHDTINDGKTRLLSTGTSKRQLDFKICQKNVNRRTILLSQSVVLFYID